MQLHAATWTRRKPDTEVHVLHDFNLMKCPEEVNPLRQETAEWLAEAEERGIWKVTYNVFMISLGDNQYVLKLDYGSDCMTVNKPKWVNFTVCKLSHNKAHFHVGLQPV